LRQTSCVLYLAIDELIPSRGNAVSGLADFFTGLDRANVPCIWLTNKTRLQLDEARRKMNNTHPFIGEGGCGLFLPEDYFHLRPQTSGNRPANAKTMRLGRFTCLPIAQPQPAAADALEALAAETNISVVPLSSLPPRELAQNTGLQPREAELARQRDFDELFFFAGATETQIASFREAARSQGMEVRERGSLWSLAVGASAPHCIRELAKLYDRALHAHARTVGLATSEDSQEFFSACDRAVLLTKNEGSENEVGAAIRRKKVMELPLRASDTWDNLLEFLSEPR
jgi:predicted mannosyl-3-phosphoglycerate phosphatase (HAD superfamily)